MKFYLLVVLAVLGCSSQPAAVDQGCSKDMNKWGNPTECRCGSLDPESDVTYDPTTGKCVSAVHGIGLCTTDKNAWGHSSGCQCPEGRKYNQVIGLCVAN
jgi:hypothetical protein